MVDISAGSPHRAVRLADGSVRCWNAYGQCSVMVAGGSTAIAVLDELDRAFAGGALVVQGPSLGIGEVAGDQSSLPPGDRG